MSSSDKEELLLALSCERKRRRRWMHEINMKRERSGEYHRLCVELQSHEDSRTLSINFAVNSSAIPYCPPGKSVSKTQMSSARRDLDRSAASARLLFDGDDAILHNNSSNAFPPRQPAFCVAGPLGRLHTHRQNRSRVRLHRRMQCK